jgi:(p)ppGpp synthase/HD superfamily hydrolase
MSNINADQSLAILLSHEDPEVRKHAENLLVANETVKQILIKLNDRLGNLKTDVQYMAFDLEATRRERDALKGMA